MACSFALNVSRHGASLNLNKHNSLHFASLNNPFLLFTEADKFMGHYYSIRLKVGMDGGPR